MAIVLADAALAQPRPSVVTNPDWLRRPDAESLAKAYPETAQRLGLEGRAVISCLVDASGLLQACSLESEQPAGLGFGAATLESAALFRMTPKTVDGRPVPGGTVRIPLRYQLPPPPKPAPETPPAVPATRPELAAETAALALALERDLIATTDDSIAEITARDRKVTDDKVRADARQALTSAARMFAAPYAKSMAAQFAAAGDPIALAAMTTFLSTPTRRAMMNAQREAERLLGETETNALPEMIEVARAAFCKTGRCKLEPPAPTDRVTPKWAKAPTPREIARATSPLAQALSLGGWVRFNCIVVKGGGLSYCTLVDEAPAGLGLAAGARTLTGTYRVDDGAAHGNLEGSAVNLVIDFPASPAPPPVSAWRAPATPDPDKLILARRVVGLEDHDDQADEVRQLLNRLAVTLPPDQAEVLAAFRGAFEEVVRRYLDRMATVYALAYSRSDLEVAIAYLAGPGGDLPRKVKPEVAAALEGTEAYYRELAVAEARRVFCQGRDCLPRATAPGAGKAGSTP